MPIFDYRAVAPGGSVIQGRIEASDRAGAVARLREQGHVPLKLEAARPVTGLRSLLAKDVGFKRRPGARLVSEFIGRLAILLEAGVSLEGALTLLSSSETASMAREQARKLLKRLRAGDGLANAMAAAGDTFPAIVVAMVRAGEVSGKLAPTLGRLAIHLDRAEAVRQSVRSALVYPAVLLVTAAGSVLLVLLVVLPQLQPIFADSGAQIPMLTRVAFGASAILRNGWWALLTAALISGFLVRHVAVDPGLRARRDTLFLKLPILGVTIRRAEAARFSRVLGTLIGGGVGLAAALALAQPVLVNAVIANAVSRVTAAVREGGGLAGPLARVGVFPDLTVQMIRLGEATGQLDSMLLKLADILESDVQRTLDRSLALMVPLLTISLGAMVAGIIASVMLAVLGVNDMVH